MSAAFTAIAVFIGLYSIRDAILGYHGLFLMGSILSAINAACAVLWGKK